MKIRSVIATLAGSTLLAACGGGGSGSGGQTLPAVVTASPTAQPSSGTGTSTSKPTPVSSSTVAPGHTPLPSASGSPSPGSTATTAPSAHPTSPTSGSPTAAPTAVPTATGLALAGGQAIGINAADSDPRTNGSDASLFPNSLANTVPSPNPRGAPYSAINGIPGAYSFPKSDVADIHFHTHLTVVDAAGNRVVIPLGIGMFGNPAAPLTTIPGANYPLTVATNGGSSGTYYLHTHDHSGMLHVEDSTAFDAQFGFRPPNPFTIGTLMLLTSETANSMQFTHYAVGAIHAYVSHIYVLNPTGPGDASTEVQTAPVEWLGDINSIPLEPFEEITIETTSHYYPVPRYYFPAYWCAVNPATGQPDCRRNEAPTNLLPAAVFRKPEGFVEKPDPT